MRRILYFSLLLVLCLTGCVYIPQDDSSAVMEKVAKPPLFVWYYPYPDLAGLSGIRPFPGYHGWHLDRMERDLERFRACSVDGVFLVLKPQDFTDALKLDMVNNFLAKCSEGEKIFQVVLVFAPQRLTRLSRNNVASFLLNKKLSEYPCLYHQENAILVGVSELVQLSDSERSDFHFGYFKEKSSVGKSLLNEEEGFFEIHLDSGSSEKRKKVFGRQMYLGLQSRRPILIHSWNGYSTALPLEPNSQEKNLMMETLQQFIQLHCQ